MKNLTLWKTAFLSTNTYLEPLSKGLPASDLEYEGSSEVSLRAGSIAEWIKLDKDGNVLGSEPGQIEFWNCIRMHAQYPPLQYRSIPDWGEAGNFGNDTLVGALSQDLIDVSLTPVAPCCGRTELIDFSQAITTRPFSIVFSQPDASGDIFLAQFQPCVWISIFIMIGILTAAMMLVSWTLKPKKSKRRKRTRMIEADSKTEAEYFSAKEALGWAFCIISQQGFDRADLPSKSGKILLLTGFLFGMICFYAFSANIVTTLTSASTINSFEELVRYPGIKFFPSYFIPFQLEIIASSNTHVKQLYKRILEDNSSRPCHDYSEGCDASIVSSILSSSSPSPFAFASPDSYQYSSSPFTEMASKDMACRATHYRVPLMDQRMSVGIRKGIGQKKRIDRAVLRMYESGLARKISDKYMPHRPECAELQTVSYRAVDFSFLWVAYMVLAVGQGVAMFTGLVEKLYYH